MRSTDVSFEEYRGAPSVLDSLPDHSRVAFYRLRLLGSARSRSWDFASQKQHLVVFARSPVIRSKEKHLHKAGAFCFKGAIRGVEHRQKPAALV